MIKILLPVLFSSFFNQPAHAGQEKQTSISQTKQPGTYSSQHIHKKTHILSKKAPDISQNALKTALKAYHCAAKRGHVKKPYLTVIDYSKPSNKPRLWTFDIATNKLLFRSWVAHGKNSGKLNAQHFSDRPNSKQSSLGLFVTAEKYTGSHGASLRLNGMEKGFNGRARPRAIVMHGASYVSSKFLKKHGRLGLSWGCPAVPYQVAKPLINKIKNGTILFTYYPKKEYFKNSKLLDC